MKKKTVVGKVSRYGLRISSFHVRPELFTRLQEIALRRQTSASQMLRDYIEREVRKADRAVASK
jgi:predicted transcriptional regulator